MNCLLCSDSTYHIIRILYVLTLTLLIAKATICEAPRLLKVADGTGTIVLYVSQCVFVFHIKLFHLLPALIPPLLVWTPFTSHSPSLHPCSLSIRELTALIR